MAAIDLPELLRSSRDAHGAGDGRPRAGLGHRRNDQADWRRRVDRTEKDKFSEAEQVSGLPRCAPSGSEIAKEYREQGEEQAIRIRARGRS